MLNKYITTTELLAYGKSMNCQPVWVLNYFYITGSKNHISNLYVLYIYNLTTDKIVTYVTIYHVPRFLDVAKLLLTLKNIDVSQIMLLAPSQNPFYSEKISSHLKSNFGIYKMFKNKVEFVLSQI